MPDAVRYIITSVLDPGTGAASSTTSGLPFTHVKDPLVRKVWRSTGKANEWLRFRASGGATSINYVGIFNHNLTKNASVLWQGNSTSNFASGPALSTALTVVTDTLGNVIPKISHFYSALQRYPHWRLYLKNSSNASSTLEIGRIFAGRQTQPTINIRDGFQISVVDPSRRRMTAGRQGYANVRRKYLEFEFGHSDVAEEQYDTMYSIFNEVGRHTSFVFALDPDSRPSHNTILCEFKNDLSVNQRIVRQYGINSIALTEKI